MPRSEIPIATLGALCREAQADRRATDDLAAYLEQFPLAEADRAALLKVGAKRLLVYRTLVHNRLRNAIRDFMPRTLARLGTERFDDAFCRYMDTVGPRSYYLREVPAEFLAAVREHWNADPSIPEYLPQLARHEILEYELRNHPGGGEDPTGRPLALDAGLAFDSTTTFVEYDYALHRLPLDPKDRTEPDQERTSLLAYRDPKELRPRYLALSLFGREVLTRLLQGMAVTPALQEACAALDEPLDDHKLGVAAQLFADLAERGVVRGAVEAADE